MIACAFLDIKHMVTRDAFQVLQLYKKKKKKNAIVTLLSSKLLTFNLSRNFDRCDENYKPKIVLSFTIQTRLRFRHLANQKRDILLST